MGGVRLESKGRTNPRWVARLAPWRAGQIYHPDSIAELERRLLDTGVYDQVTVALAPASQAVNGERPVIVSLADRPKSTVELGVSYATTEGPGVDSSWILYNRLGLADTLTNTVRVAVIDSRLQTQLALPHWRKPEETLKLTAALYRDNTPAYDDIGAGVSADVTHRYGKTSFFTYGVSLDATDTTETEEVNFVLGRQAPEAGHLRPPERLLARPVERSVEPDPGLEARRAGRADGSASATAPSPISRRPARSRAICRSIRRATR